MRRAPAGAAILLLAGAASLPAQVIDVRAARPAAGNTFEALWAAYLKADRGGDAENAKRVFQEIRRLRIERNIESLEVIALGLVAQGHGRLAKGERDKAEELFRSAVGLDPYLPDAYFGLGRTQFKRGPLGILPGVRDTLNGVVARLPTVRGQYYLQILVVVLGLVAVFATTFAVALALVVRHGTLLLHDLEEGLGWGRSHSVALAFYVMLLLLPVATFQGYAWLPLWWLALLFIYFNPTEKAVAVLVLLASLGVGPLVKVLERSVLEARNPLFWASVLAVEGGPDARATAQLEAATKRYPDDRDLVYLLAAEQKAAGRYEDAAELYQGILRVDPNDGIAKNNLANLEFARGEYPSAIARYKQGTEAGGPPEITATFFYNQSLAHLQRFEYQPAQEARTQADRLAPSLTAAYDRRWKYDKGDFAVVDLGLAPQQLWTKFSGVPDGVGVKNLAGRAAGSAETSGLVAAMLNRFTAFIVVFVVVVLGLSTWRGAKMFTMHCAKCGTAFCRHCHLGAVVADLCTQCYHLFIVRDGVSGPARNRKLLEVQKEDQRRGRVFRLLSLVSPGTGHVYARSTLLGLGFAFVWYLVLAAVLLVGRLLPVSGAPAGPARIGGLAAAALVLLVVYMVANRMRPAFDVLMPVRRGTGRRVRAS